MKLNKKGFTLVELLAVIVIIALLMVVLMSVMGNVQENAYKGALQTETMKLVNAYQTEQESAVMIGETAENSGLKSVGTDYTYSVEVGVDGKVSKYCVNYKDKYSTYGTDNPSSKPATVDIGETGSCTISSDGTITVK